MTVPPRWYRPPKDLPEGFEAKGLKRFSALLRLQWWHVPNLVTETRGIGAFLLPALIPLLVTSTIPEDKLWLFFQDLNVFIGLWKLISYVGFLLAWTFLLIALTDMLDGFLAKKIFGTSNLGAVLDPALDKFLMLISIIVALVVTGMLGLWLVFWALVIVAIFLAIREWDVYRLKRAEYDARTDDKVTSARQSGRVSMTVFCVAIFAALTPIIGLWSSCIKSVLILSMIIFSGLSWLDYRREYGKYLK